MTIAPDNWKLAIITPFVTVLPVRTLVNVNTASAEALSAAVPTMAMATAQKLVAERNRSHFRTLGDAIKYAPEISNSPAMIKRYNIPFPYITPRIPPARCPRQAFETQRQIEMPGSLRS